MFAKFPLKNQRNFTIDETNFWMFLFSKQFLKLISECLLVSSSPSRVCKKNIFAQFQIPIFELFPLAYPDLESENGHISIINNLKHKDDIRMRNCPPYRNTQLSQRILTTIFSPLHSRGRGIYTSSLLNFFLFFKSPPKNMIFVLFGHI